MATVNFLYRSTKSKSNLTIRLLFSHEGNDFVFASKSKIEVSADYWKNQHKKQIIKDPEDRNYQTSIKEKINDLNDYILYQFENTNVADIDKIWFNSQVDNFYNPKQPKKNISSKLSEYIDYYIKCKEIDLSKRSIQKFKTIQSKIEEMEKHLSEEIHIKDIDENFKNEFVNYYNSQSYSKNTTQRELSFIKTFCRHARLKGIETSHELDGLILKKEKVEKIYLSFKELEQIEKVKLDKEHLDHVRQWLIISCYTGQRVSDFLRFNKSMIRTEDGIKLIEFTQQKTGKIMTLALHPKVVQILESNNGEFPHRISDQKYNDYIKTVCEIAKLTKIIKGGKMNKETKRKEVGNFPKYELITSHIGRRSFCTNFYGEIPTALLISASGHSSEALFLEYLGKSQSDQTKQLAKYW